MPGRPLFPPKPTRAWANTEAHTTFINSPDWIVEPKMDGDRCLVQYTDTGVELWNRHGAHTRFTWLEPLRVELAAWDLPVGVILDCELVAEPKPKHELYVFDVPTAEGTLAERRTVLEELFEGEAFNHIHLVPSLDKATAYERVLKEGWEGIVWKRLDSLYPWKKSNTEAPFAHWVKMKPAQDFGP